ncbi:hypothetical protein CDD80_5164 [Ophiocordyceps camponoti-rufipedis]|uniref:Uncharacterized protein n=1 Tax=Ophiocordyceps camponoti-rufipedis TaxID=2004952 RepID=A0A2C5ZNH3_9HYPO|nr:hypothetical protein CDD80_5164 [Ophiocordyceps camponoti-rufipedis]
MKQRSLFPGRDAPDDPGDPIGEICSVFHQDGDTECMQVDNVNFNSTLFVSHFVSMLRSKEGTGRGRKTCMVDSTTQEDENILGLEPGDVPFEARQPEDRATSFPSDALIKNAESTDCCLRPLTGRLILRHMGEQQALAEPGFNVRFLRELQRNSATHVRVGTHHRTVGLH